MRREAWDCARNGSNGAVALRWDGGRIARLGCRGFSATCCL